MSYDLTLFRVPAGSNPARMYADLREQEEREGADPNWARREVSQPAWAQMCRVADALRSWRPALSEFDPVSPGVFIELDDEDIQIQFTIYESKVHLTMPYFSERRSEMMACMAGSIEVLERAAGYSAYDPQIGRIVTAKDLNSMRTGYDRVDAVLPDLLPKSGKPLEKPWWKLW